MRDVTAVAYAQIESQDDVRVSSGVAEFDRVLGGGIVPGTLVLIGGDPGIGKSTLLLQVADRLSASGAVVLYVSGEESERQIKLRGERLAFRPQILFVAETNLENVFHEIERLKPPRLSSIRSKRFFGCNRVSPGSVLVGEGSGTSSFCCQEPDHSVFLIGHVTKTDRSPDHEPRTYRRYGFVFRERHHNHRIVCATKVGFGAANEVGFLR